MELSHQVGLSDQSLVVLDRHGIGGRVPDEDDFPLCPGEPGIHEVSLEHHEMLLE